MERVTPLEPPYAPDVAERLAAMMPPGVEPLRLFRVLARNPRILAKIQASNLLDRGSVERVDRELVILRTCARCRSEYEWGVHVAIFARRFGFSEDKIAGTAEWSGSDPRWSAKEGLLVRLADALYDEAAVEDALWTELRANFAVDQLLELLVLAGFYHTISFVTNALRIDREANADRFPLSAAVATARGATDSRA